MVYAEQFVYLRALGTFGVNASTPVERWGVGLKFRNPGTAPSPDNLIAFLETVSVPFENFHKSTAVGSGTSCFLQELTAALVGVDGKYVGGAAQQTTRRAYSTPPAGTGGLSVSFSQALVYSLRTLLTRGPGSNGRMYYPALGIAVTPTTGVIASGVTASAAAAAATLFNNLNAAADAHLPGTGGLSVMSQVGTGVAASVTSVRVGNKMDHQESRERQITEAYSSSPVSALAAFVVQNLDRPIGSS